MANQDFSSDSFKHFKFFHEELNGYVKLSVSAIDHLSDKSGDSETLSSLIQNLILAAGERWTPTNFENPYEELNKLRSQLTKSAIMWVFSSFEVFLNHVHSSCSEAIVMNVDQKERRDNESIRLEDLFVKYGWEISSLNYLIPSFNFYSLARHCIVHNMGKASKELRDMSTRKEFVESIINWPTVIEKRKLSPPPIVNEDGSIDFNPHHAITYSDICFRIAKVINRNILNLLGLKFYLDKTLKKHLLDVDKLSIPVCSDLYSYLNFHLKKDYGLDTLEIVEIKENLSDGDLLKKANKKHLDLKANIR